MRRLIPILFLLVVACGSTPPGTLMARISADPALSSAFTTEDGWTLTFTHVVLAVSGVTVKGGDVTGASPLPKPKLFDFGVTTRIDLVTNMMAAPRAYDTVSVVMSRNTSEENVNVTADVLQRAGNRPLYIEGTATKQSTTRQFQLGLPKAHTFSGCMPAVTVESGGSAIVDFVVHAQRAFLDDAGKLRFEAWALADASPVDGIVLNTEAQNVQTSTLPMAHYGQTTGSLLTVLEKRALTFVGLGDSGSCSGAAQ